MIQDLGSVGPVVYSDGVDAGLRLGKAGDQIMSELHGRYYEQAYRKNLFMAHAIVTVPVAYTTAAATGGPLLWNGSSSVNASILAVGFGVTTANTTTSFALGLTGNTGQTSAPTSTTAIDSRTNLYIGGAASNCTPYRVGTVANAGSFFLPFAGIHTGAVTVDTSTLTWVDLGGAIVVPPNAWCSVASSVAGTAVVLQICMLYEESAI